MFGEILTMDEKIRKNSDDGMSYFKGN